MEFHYDMNPELEICKLGRCRGTFDNKNEFVIDGAGGEVIETVEVDLTRIDFYNFLKHGKLCAVKVRIPTRPLSYGPLKIHTLTLV